MNKKKLASKIWETANNMRSKIEASEYKDFILGFIFYKFLSEKEEKYLLAQNWSEEDIETLIDDGYDPQKIDNLTKNNLSDEQKDHLFNIEYCQKNIGYFISYKNLFSTWLKSGKDFDISNVTDALSAFERLINVNYKKVFHNIFETLATGLSKLGDTAQARTKAVRDLIDLIKDIPMDDNQGYDVLGYIYEYLISQFAANAGKKAGEFYTPHEVSVLMSEIIAHHLRDRESIEIYDPTSGSGSLLINIGKSISKYLVKKDKIKYYAQELKEPTYNLTRMNLIMRGILPANIEVRRGDTLADDWPYFDENDREATYETLYLDAVVSNPPYSQKWDSQNKENDPRYSRFGVAPKSKADYAFLLHDLYHLKSDGIMTIVLPHGVLFRGGEEEKIRRNLIENNNIDAIIGLPANIFFGTGIPTIVMVLKQKRPGTDVVIVDASKEFIKEGKNNKLLASHIKKIADAVINRSNIDKYSRVVSKDEIRKNDYNLNIPRYVDSSEEPESWDIYATMFGGIPNNELEKFNKYWQEFPLLKEQLLEKLNNEYYNFKTDDIKDIIYNNEGVKKFINNYNESIDDLPNILSNLLILEAMNINVSNAEANLAQLIFERIEKNPFIDKYKSYQILDEAWSIISSDIEVLQTEGFDSVRQYLPNMVEKKKGEDKGEVQDGWVGKIIPLELIEKEFFPSLLKQKQDIENNLSNIESTLTELFESINEEDKEANLELFNENGDKFVTKELKKYAKKLNSSELKEDEFDYIVYKTNSLSNEKTKLNNSLKSIKADLTNKTIEQYPKLTDNDVNSLLFEKWIAPLFDRLTELPTILIKDFTSQLVKLSKKYSETLNDLTNQINSTEKELTLLLDELEGSEFDMKGLEEFKKLLNGE